MKYAATLSALGAVVFLSVYIIIANNPKQHATQYKLIPRTILRRSLSEETRTTAVAYLACDATTLDIICNSVQKLRQSRYTGPVVVISPEALVNTCHDVTVMTVERIDYPDFMKQRANPRNHRYCRYTKFQLWNLDYDRIVYLDWDTWVTGSIDGLLSVWPQKPNMIAAVRDTVGPMLNSGVMVLRPNAATFKALVNHSQTTIRQVFSVPYNPSIETAGSHSICT